MQLKQIEDSMPLYLSEAHRQKQRTRIESVQRMQEQPVSAEQLQEQCLRIHRDSMKANMKARRENNEKYV